MAGIRELREIAHAAQGEVSQKANISRFRLSFAECGYEELTPEEDKAVRAALLELMKERSVRFLNALREQPQK